jgi:hypothetical protein
MRPITKAEQSNTRSSSVSPRRRAQIVRTTPPPSTDHLHRPAASTQTDTQNSRKLAYPPFRSLAAEIQSPAWRRLASVPADRLRRCGSGPPRPVRRSSAGRSPVRAEDKLGPSVGLRTRPAVAISAESIARLAATMTPCGGAICDGFGAAPAGCRGPWGAAAAQSPRPRAGRGGARLQPPMILLSGSGELTNP